MKVIAATLILVGASVSGSILVEGVNDKPLSTGFFNGTGQAGVSVIPDRIIDHNQPRYLNFYVSAGQWLGDTEFAVLIQLPEYEWPGDPYLKLKRGEEELIAEDYIEQADDYKAEFLLSIPAFAHGETVQVSIGWYAAEHEKYGALYDIQTDSEPVALMGTWQGDQSKHRRN